MRRVLGFVVALVGALAAGLILWRAPPVTMPAAALAVPAADARGQAVAASAAASGAIDAPRAEMSDAQREARRFGRYDKDKDGKVSRAEYLVNRKKAFAKADVNHDGRLDFEEFAVATATKFARADRSGDGVLSPTEFAATAVKRKPRAACVCTMPAEE